MKSIDKFVLVLVASLALLLAGCGGGSSTPETPPAPPPPSAYEMALGAINAATTPEDAQAAYDAVKDDVTAAEGEQLQMAVDNRQAALAMMARADAQKMDLMNAAGMVDTSDLSTQEAVDAARTAIAGLRQAIADAVDVADTSMYQSMLDNAVAAVDEAQGGIDTATRRTNQMDALSDASGMLQAALAALSGSTPTQAQLDAANNAVTALNAAIAAGADLTDAEKATYVREAANAAAPISTAQMAFDDAEGDAQRKADTEMAAMAAKLYAAIGTDPLARNKPESATGTDVDDTTGALTVATYQSGGTTDGPTSVLEVDKMAMVAPLHGWTGSMHTKTEPTTNTDGSLNANRGTYTAQMYANVGEPTQGKKFGSAAAVTADGDFQYELDANDRAGNANKALTIVPATHAQYISLPGVTRTAGTETFKLPDPTPTNPNPRYIAESGMLHGVSGTFSCDTGTSRDQTCTASVAAQGFTLGTNWVFIPSNADARVTDMPDNEYVVYGWWLHENGDDATVSAFTAMRGAVTTATGIDTLNGTAIYRGGAAGKYTVRAGANNDAGHFTADAKLMADFSDNSVTGTIDNFMGSDGMSRDWSVELKENMIGAAGPISSDGTATGAGAQTAWTMGGSAATADGEWSGTLYDNDDSGVPQVGTGTFHSTYGNIGRMVGAFGVNLEN